MPVQRRLIAVSFDVPQPDRLVKASTGQRAPIWAPGHAKHPVRMPRKRLETASAGYVPQPDGPVPARARELGAIGCESKSRHPMGMPQEYLHAGGWLCPLQLPHPNASIEAATGEQLAVRAPGQRVHSAALTSQRLHVHAGDRIPEPDERIIPAAGEQAPIRGKGHSVDAVRMPIRPEQGYL